MATKDEQRTTRTLGRYQLRNNNNGTIRTSEGSPIENQQ
jgi:hypothetical protein